MLYAHRGGRGRAVSGLGQRRVANIPFPARRADRTTTRTEPQAGPTTSGTWKVRRDEAVGSLCRATRASEEGPRRGRTHSPPARRPVAQVAERRACPRGQVGKMGLLDVGGGQPASMGGRHVQGNSSPRLAGLFTECRNARVGVSAAIPIPATAPLAVPAARPQQRELRRPGGGGSRRAWGRPSDSTGTGAITLLRQQAPRRSGDAHEGEMTLAARRGVASVRSGRGHDVLDTGSAS